MRKDRGWEKRINSAESDISVLRGSDDKRGKGRLLFIVTKNIYLMLLTNVEYSVL